MGVETIVRFIEREAAEESVRLIAEAEERARRRVAAAEAAAAAGVAAACERAEPAIRARCARRVNAARLQLLERRAVAAARRIEAVFDAAGAELERIAAGADPKRWADALDRLAGEAIAAVGAGAVVRVRAADAELLAASVAAHGARLERDLDEGAPAGPTVTAADGRFVIDATIAARLSRARGRFAGDVARALGPAG